VPKASKRDQLLDAAKELLWDVGYEAMSPRDIQDRSGARPGSLYHHFPSKLAIAGEALCDLAKEDVASTNDFFSTDAAPLDAVRQYLFLKRDGRRGCRFGRLVNETSIESEEIRRPVTAYFDAVRTNLAQSLHKAKEEGTLPPDLDTEALSISLLALIQGGGILAKAYQDYSYFDRAMEGALALISGVARA